MAILVEFKNVSLFKEQPFGIKNISFKIERGRKYHLSLNHPEKVKSVSGLIEGRYRKESGYIERASRLFIQSDRLLMGEKQIMKEANKFLAMDSEMFGFGGRRRSKFGFIQTLKAKHLLDYPVYKLKGTDRIKFTLLALAFQETGLILISQLLGESLEEDQQEFLLRIISQTHTTCCLVSSGTSWINDRLEEIPELISLSI